MKKLLLSLGALSAVVAPVAAVVACGSTDSDSALDKQKAAFKSDIAKFGKDDATKAELNKKVDALKTNADILAFTSDADFIEITKAKVAANLVSGVQTPATATDTTFDADVTAYQALQVMAYTDHSNKVAVVIPEGDDEWTYSSATTFDHATAANGKSKHQLLSSNAADKAKASALLTAAKTAFDNTLKTFKAVVAEIKDSITTESAIEKAGEAVLKVLENPTKTYADVAAIVTDQLDTFLTDEAAITGLDKLETLGEVTVDATKVILSDKEANLLKVGAPLLIKLSKTIAGLTAITA